MKRLLFIAVLVLGWSYSARADEVDNLLDKGERLVSYGKLPAAEKTFRKALALSPRNITVIDALAQVTEFQQKWDDSALFFLSYYYLDRETIPDPTEGKTKVAELGKKIYHAGTLTLRVTPGDAELFIDDLPVGRGQVVLPTAPGRKYTVRAKLADYHEVEPEGLVLSDHEERDYTIRLRKIVYTGKVKFRIFPTGDVKVYVDAKPMDATKSPITVVEGRHLICFQKEGFDRWWRAVTVPRNGEASIEVKLRDTTAPDESCEEMPDDF